jgi:hypothetical protein
VIAMVKGVSVRGEIPSLSGISTVRRLFSPAALAPIRRRGGDLAGNLSPGRS